MSTTPDPTRPATARISTLDILRGAAMFFIAGGGPVICLLATLLSADLGKAVSTQFTHVSWEGFRLFDGIFPTFLAVSGAAFTFAWNKRISQGDSASSRWGHLALRTLVLILLGMIYNGVLQQTSLNHMRFPSVLGRIGLGVFFAAIPYTLIPKKWRWSFFPAGLILYALLFWCCGGETPYAQANNWVGKIDSALLPGCFDSRAAYDAEGIVSTLGALLTAYLGMLLGDFLTSSVKYKPLRLAAAAALLLGAGYGVSPWVPVIKKLWTSSFVCVSGGWMLLVASGVYFLADTLKGAKWFKPITFIGSSALAFYFLPRLINFTAVADFFIGGALRAWMPDSLRPLLSAAAGFLALWLTVRYLLRRR